MKAGLFITKRTENSVHYLLSQLKSEKQNSSAFLGWYLDQLKYIYSFHKPF